MFLTPLILPFPLILASPKCVSAVRFVRFRLRGRHLALRDVIHEVPCIGTTDHFQVSPLSALRVFTAQHTGTSFIFVSRTRWHAYQLRLCASAEARPRPPLDKLTRLSANAHGRRACVHVRASWLCTATAVFASTRLQSAFATAIRTNRRASKKVCRMRILPRWWDQSGMKISCSTRKTACQSAGSQP